MQRRQRWESTGRESKDEGVGIKRKKGQKKKEREDKRRSAASASFQLSFFKTIVSKSHFPANLEASKIHSTPYLKP